MKPPIMVPINMPKLISSRKIPFANSGDSLTEEVIQYCVKVHTEPSNSANMHSPIVSYISYLMKCPIMNIAHANPIGYKRQVVFGFLIMA